MRSELIIKTKCPECGRVNVLPKFDLDIVFDGATTNVKGFGYNCLVCNKQTIFKPEKINKKSAIFEGL